MAQVHITEAELVRDIRAVLEEVRQGTEVVIEQGHRSVAILKPVSGRGRRIDEYIALAKALGMSVIPGSSAIITRERKGQCGKAALKR